MSITSNKVRKLTKTIISASILALLLSSCGPDKEEAPAPHSDFVVKYMDKAKEVKADPVLDMSVYPDKRFNPNKLGDCAVSLDPYACYLTVVFNSYKQTGLSKTLASLASSDIGSNSDCYRISKGIGALLASLEPVDSKLQLLTAPYYACPPSFVEGVYDQVFGTLDFQSLKEKAPSICMGMSKEVSWACHYYLGRTLMNMKLSDPEVAAAACMTIPSPDDSKGNHKTMRRSCLSGAWQTFFRDSKVLSILKSLNPVAKNIFEFCLTDMSSSKDVCLQEDSPAFWQIPNLGDISDRFKACREISNDRNEIDQCYFGMGRGVSDANQRENGKIIRDCALLINEQDSDYCFIASGEALNNKDFVSGVNDFCKGLRSEIEELCIRSLGMQAFGQMGGDHVQASEICAKLDNEVSKDRCLEGVLAGKTRVGFVHSTEDLSVDSIYISCPESISVVNCYKSALVGSENYYKKLTGSKLLSFCSKLANQFSSPCSFGVGRAAGSYENDSNTMIKLCNLNGDCLKGLAESVGKRSDSIYSKVCSTGKVSCIARKPGEYF